VVHEDARILCLEAEGERLAGLRVAERDVRCDSRRVEVDRMRDRPAAIADIGLVCSSTPVATIGAPFTAARIMVGTST
jgi:hypothetical protein